jgi:hypothetical protein
MRVAAQCFFLKAGADIFAQTLAALHLGIEQNRGFGRWSFTDACLFLLLGWLTRRGSREALLLGAAVLAIELIPLLPRASLIGIIGCVSMAAPLARAVPAANRIRRERALANREQGKPARP